MKKNNLHQLLSIIIALVWLINGLFCKVLGLVPRHEMIVAKILGTEHSRVLTILIGIAEILMAVWILSKIKPRFNAIAQIIIIATMNTLEFFLAPELLLWGKYNSLYAVMFIVLIWSNELVRRDLSTIAQQN